MFELSDNRLPCALQRIEIQMIDELVCVQRLSNRRVANNVRSFRIDRCRDLGSIGFGQFYVRVRENIRLGYFDKPIRRLSFDMNGEAIRPTRHQITRPFNLLPFAPRIFRQRGGTTHPPFVVEKNYPRRFFCKPCARTQVPKRQLLPASSDKPVCTT